MKKVLYFISILLILLPYSIYAGSKPQLYSFHVVETQLNLTKCHLDGTPVDPSVTEAINAGLKIKICNVLPDDKYVISVCFFPNDDRENRRLVFDQILKTGTEERNLTGNVPDDGYTVKYFLLKKEDVPHLDTLLKRLSFQYVNITSLPGKLRFGAGNKTFKFPDGKTYTRQFNVEGSINIGYAIGGQVRLDRSNKLFFNFIGGASVGSISVDSASTKGYANNNTKVALAVTPFVGAYIQYTSVQFGLLSGIDFPTGKIGQNWIWRNQPWLGIGVGVSIFAPPTKSAKAKEENK